MAKGSDSSAATATATDTATAAGSRKRSASKDHEEEDALTILNAVIHFKSKNHGSHPTPSTLAPFHDSLKGRLHQPLSIDSLYTKFRTLRNKYYRAINQGVGSSPFEKTFFDLSVKAWGEKAPGEIKPKETKSKKQQKDGGDDRKRQRKKKMIKAEEEGDDDLKSEKQKVEEDEENGSGSEDDDNDEEDDDPKPQEHSSKKQRKIEFKDDSDLKPCKKQKMEAEGQKILPEENGDESEDEEDSDESGDEKSSSEDKVEGEVDVDEQFEAVCSEFKCLSSNLKKYWEEQGLSMFALKHGLSNMDRSKAAGLERMWREYDIEDMEVNSKLLDAKCQVLKTLAAALR